MGCGPLVAALGGFIASGQIGAEANLDPEMLPTYDWDPIFLPGDLGASSRYSGAAQSMPRT